MEEFKLRKKSKMEEAGESWAVSYADLLMVLMSFFIIFFSQEEKNNSNSLFAKIISGIQEQTGASMVDEEGNKIDVAKESTATKFFPGFSEDDRKPASIGGNVIENLQTKSGFKLVISKIAKDQLPESNNTLDSGPAKSDSAPSKMGVQIDLVENIYQPGGYHLSADAQTQLNKILDALKPYKDQINLVFVGHTDDTPVKEGKKIIESNMILSSLRASKAVEFAVSKGYGPYWVSAQGLAEFSRNTRSLSLRVMER